MSKTLLNIKIHYDEFSKTEKKIADFLMQNPDCILPLFITELAEKCGTSEATVVRFAKRLGFDGDFPFCLCACKKSSDDIFQIRHSWRACFVLELCVRFFYDKKLYFRFRQGYSAF